jgi:hypothetical protein
LTSFCYPHRELALLSLHTGTALTALYYGNSQDFNIVSRETTELRSAYLPHEKRSISELIEELKTSKIREALILSQLEAANSESVQGPPRDKDTINGIAKGD